MLRYVDTLTKEFVNKIDNLGLEAYLNKHIDDLGQEWLDICVLGDGNEPRAFPGMRFRKIYPYVVEPLVMMRFFEEYYEDVYHQVVDFLNGGSVNDY